MINMWALIAAMIAAMMSIAGAAMQFWVIHSFFTALTG